MQTPFLECPNCNALQCVACNDKLKDKSYCLKCIEDNVKWIDIPNKIVLGLLNKLQATCEICLKTYMWRDREEHWRKCVRW